MTQPIGTSLKEIIGGTPIEVLVKLVLAGVAALWANLEVIGMSAFLNFIMIVIDAGLGAAISKRKGNELSIKYLISGPSKKFLLMACMLLAAAVTDSLIPGNFLFYGVTMFISAASLLDVAKKYGTLSGSKLANWIEEKLGTLLPKDEDKKAA